MRKIFLLLFTLVMLLLMAMAPFPQEDPGGIPAGLVVILTSLVIPILIQVLKWIAAWFGVTYSENVLMIICFALGAIVAFIWLMPVFPVFPVFTGDPADVMTNVLDWIAGALTVIGSVFGLATLIYRSILKSVFGALGLGNPAITRLADRNG